MSQVLLLTKNILSNQALQERLQQLNYEVWCSAQLVEQVQRFGTPPSVIQQFQGVIFSKTICDYEAEALLGFFARYPIAILRETEKMPTAEEQTSWLEQGLHGWVLEEESLISLREKLAQTQTAVMQKMDATNNRVVPFPNGDAKRELEALQVHLTGKERKLMDLLIKAQGELMTRKEICEAIWTEGETPSNMSQLSCMVNRIKRKFEEQGVEGKVIVTHWGKGYQLSEAFYQQCVGYDKRTINKYF